MSDAPKKGTVFEGRDPRTGKKAFRTYIETDLGGSVYFRRGKGTRRKCHEERCTAAEWRQFTNG